MDNKEARTPQEHLYGAAIDHLSRPATDKPRPVPGSHAAPQREGHSPSHMVSTCEHCGETISRSGITREWFHYQTDEVQCRTESR